MNPPNTVRLALIALLLAVAGWLGWEQINAPTPSNPTQPPDTIVTAPIDTLTPYDQVGINITWAHDQLINAADPSGVGKIFRHVRYFQMMEKDYAGGNPGISKILPCTNLANPWACPENSMRQHLVRVKELRAMFDGYIWIAPEVLAGRGWPCKGWTARELGADPYQAGYEWGRVALATFGTVPGIILAMDNEEWCHIDQNRPEAYNEWRRGIIQAHRENPSCELAIGARHVRPKNWENRRLTDNVTDVAPDIWAYIDSIGGWADYHAHGIEGDRFLPRDRAHTATDFRDFFEWSQWLDDNYTGIRKSVGEIAYTSSSPLIVPPPNVKQADWPTLRSLVDTLRKEADLVFIYQIAEHPNPEGAFSGSGVLPELKDSLQAYLIQKNQ